MYTLHLQRCFLSKLIACLTLATTIFIVAAFESRIAGDILIATPASHKKPQVRLCSPERREMASASKLENVFSL